VRGAAAGLGAAAAAAARCQPGGGDAGGPLAGCGDVNQGSPKLLLRDSREAGASQIVRSQAGAWEPSRSLGTREQNPRTTTRTTTRTIEDISRSTAIRGHTPAFPSVWLSRAVAGSPRWGRSPSSRWSGRPSSVRGAAAGFGAAAAAAARCQPGGGDAGGPHAGCGDVGEPGRGVRHAGRSAWGGFPLAPKLRPWAEASALTAPRSPQLPPSACPDRGATAASSSLARRRDTGRRGRAWWAGPCPWCRRRGQGGRRSRSRRPEPR